MQGPVRKPLCGAPAIARRGLRLEAPRGIEGPLRGPREGEGPPGRGRAPRHVPPGGHVLRPRRATAQAPRGRGAEGGAARVLRTARRGRGEGEPRDPRPPTGRGGGPRDPAAGVPRPSGGPEDEG